VTLSGEVHSFIEKKAVGKAAKRVKGVRGLAEELTAHIVNAPKTSDAEIAKGVPDILALNVTVPDDKIIA
jgi:hypothetical protein